MSSTKVRHLEAGDEGFQPSSEANDKPARRRIKKRWMP